MTTRLTRWLTTLDNFEAKMAQLPAVRRYGRLTRATGLVLEATGLQLPLGATCVIERQNGSETHEVESEVVGFNGQRLFLMPLEEVEDGKVFHAGTKLADDEQVVTSGGRVLCVTALGPTVAEAQKRAYALMTDIHWDDCFCRKDIGWRAIEREQN